MAKKIEFIDSYIVKDGMDYEFQDNHGTLIRCKDCEHWEEEYDNCILNGMNVQHDDYCSKAERAESKNSDVQKRYESLSEEQKMVARFLLFGDPDYDALLENDD